MSAIQDRWQAMAARERLVIAVLAFVVIVALLWFAFFRGGSDDIQGFSGPATSPRPAASATTTTRPTPVPETFEVFEGKDPFQPLIAPSQAPGPAPTGSPSPGDGSPPPSAEPTPGQRVTLVEIFTRDGTRYATVEVNGTDYTVKEGDTFASNYRVIDLTDRCGTFVYGDERFTLCEGQEVLK